jgi:type VI secretion system protein ImpM
MTGAPGSPAVGYYGKLPSRGDFLTQRLAAAFVEPWDEWLQACLVESKAALGEAWLDAYLSAPLWRFMLPAGVAGGSAMIGMMMASVDRAGRYFPLTLAAALPADPVLAQCFACNGWFAQLEKAALHALDEGVALEDFDAGVAALAPPPETPQSAPEDWGDGATHVSLVRDELDPLAPLAAFAAGSIYDGRAVFWTLGSPRVAPAALLLAGLPPAKRFAGMLDDTPGGTAAPPAAPAGEADAALAAAAPGSEPEWPPAEFPPPEFPPPEFPPPEFPPSESPPGASPPAPHQAASSSPPPPDKPA